MRLEQFEYLIEVANHQSITKASKQLNITPQALSLSIKNLENELGFRLFDRTNKGISVTDGGKSLIKITKQFLSSIHTLQSKLAPAKTQASLSYAIMSTMGGISTFFPYFLSHLYQKYPGSQVKIDYQPYQNVISRINDGSHEFALYDKVIIQDKPREIIDEAITFIPFFQYKLFGVIPNDLPIAHQSSVSMKTLLKYPFVLTVLNQNLQLSSYDLLFAFGKPKEIIYAADLVMANEMVSAGLGVSLKMIPPNVAPEKYSLPNAKLIPLSNRSIQIHCGYLSRQDISALSSEAQQIITEIETFMSCI